MTQITSILAVVTVFIGIRTLIAREGGGLDKGGSRTSRSGDAKINNHAQSVHENFGHAHIVATNETNNQ